MRFELKEHKIAPHSSVFSQVVYQSLSVLCLVTLILESWVLYKVVRSIKRNPYFVVMLACLHISLLTSIVFFQLQAQVIRSQVSSRVFYCTNAISNYLPALFLAFATTLNTNKWIYFNQRVRALKHRHHHGVWILNIISFVSILVMGIFCTVYMVTGCDAFIDQSTFVSKVQKPLQRIFAVWFCTLAIIFTTSALLLLMTFKHQYPDFYAEFRLLLWSTTIVMALPLILRAILDLMWESQWWQQLWHQATDTQITVYNTVFFLSTTYIQIIGQTLALVFGFVRHIKSQHPVVASEIQSDESIAPVSATASITSENTSFFDPPLDFYRNPYQINTDFVIQQGVLDQTPALGYLQPDSLPAYSEHLLHEQLSLLSNSSGSHQSSESLMNLNIDSTPSSESDQF